MKRILFVATACLLLAVSSAFCFSMLLLRDAEAASPAAQKTAGERKLLGKRMFSLQWLLDGEKIKYGTANITRKDTGLHIDARHELNGNYAILKGDLVVVDPTEFTVTGELVTRVSYINNGKECPRNGTFTFKATGKRKYWRMQAMENPCQNVLDYVDVYF